MSKSTEKLVKGQGHSHVIEINLLDAAYSGIDPGHRIHTTYETDEYSPPISGQRTDIRSHHLGPLQSE